MTHWVAEIQRLGGVLATGPLSAPPVPTGPGGKGHWNWQPPGVRGPSAAEMPHIVMWQWLEPGNEWGMAAKLAEDFSDLAIH